MSRSFRTLLLTACLFGFSLSPVASPQTQTQTQTPAAYVCPMHPAVTSHAPGSCPQCKMKLVAKAPASSVPQSQTPAASGNASTGAAPVQTRPPTNWA